MCVCVCIGLTILLFRRRARGYNDNNNDKNNDNTVGGGEEEERVARDKINPGRVYKPDTTQEDFGRRNNISAQQVFTRHADEKNKEQNIYRQAITLYHEA